MIDYGKFAASREALTDDETGQTHSIIMLRNEAGQTWHEVAQANPSPVYIAVDDNNRIVAMETDYQSIQIAGVKLIGLPDTMGHTRGPGGTVYGMAWNGQAIVEPAPQVSTPSNSPLNRFQFETLVLFMGLSIQQLEAAISAMPVSPFEKAVALSRLRNATSYNRDHPLVEQVRHSIGMSVADLDNAWMQAASVK